MFLIVSFFSISLIIISEAPETHGLPIPLATTAAWLVIPPLPVSIPLAACIPCISSGLVSDLTNITLSPLEASLSASSAVNTTNLTVTDKFILVNSGSNTASDNSGLVFGGSEGTLYSGSSLFWNGAFNSNDGRVAVASGVASTSTTATPGYYMAGVISGSENEATGSQVDHYGNIRIESGDIYIYV